MVIIRVDSPNITKIETKVSLKELVGESMAPDNSILRVQNIANHLGRHKSHHKEGSFSTEVYREMGYQLIFQCNSNGKLTWRSSGSGFECSME